MNGRPSIDQILDKGRGRQKRLELYLGLLVLAGGLSVLLVIPGVYVVSFGALGIGMVMTLRGLFGSGGGDHTLT